MHLFELTKQHLPTTHLLNSLNGQSSNDTLFFLLHPGEKNAPTHAHKLTQIEMLPRKTRVSFRLTKHMTFYSTKTGPPNATPQRAEGLRPY